MKMKRISMALFFFSISFFASSYAAEPIDLKANSNLMISLNSWFKKNNLKECGEINTLIISKNHDILVLEFSGSNLTFTDVVPNGLKALFGSNSFAFKAGIDFGLIVKFSPESGWKTDNMLTHEKITMALSNNELKISLNEYIASLRTQLLKLLTEHTIVPY